MLGLETPVTRFHFFFQKKYQYDTKRHNAYKANINKIRRTIYKKNILKNNKKYTFRSKTDIIKCVFHIKKKNKTEKM